MRRREALAAFYPAEMRGRHAGARGKLLKRQISRNSLLLDDFPQLFSFRFLSPLFMGRTFLQKMCGL